MKQLRHILLTLLLGLTSMTSAQILSEQAVISLLSCSPGEPLYFHYGHSCLRIQDPHFTAANGQTGAIDWVFNYGIFDFNTEDFYLKFVRGETDYMLGLEDMTYFESSAAYFDRTISYQPLRLKQDEKQAIFDALLVNYQPENRFYRYNFVYDNCATRPWSIMRKVLNLPEAEGMSGISWRKATDHYSGKWTWGKYGINLLFGYEADREMTREESLFLPENLMNYVAEQHLSEQNHIIPFVPRDGTFKTSPEMVTLLLLLVILFFTARDVNHEKKSWWLDALLFILYFALGCIIFVMFFFSSHPFVGSNMLILFLNPLWLIPLIALFKDKWRHMLLSGSRWIALAQIVCLGIYLIVGQTLHPILLLLFTHMFRLCWLHKKQQ